MIKANRKIFKVSELVPADYNPRKINKKSLTGLTKSLGKFGYLQDIIVNTRDNKNKIVGGHQRLIALELPPTEEIECTIVDLSELQEKALNVALNNRHTSGEYDSEGLEKILAELKDGLEDFDELNFDDLAIEFDFNFEEDTPGDGDNVPEVVDDPVIKLGDLIEMGGHRLLCGDSTDKEHVERLMGGEKADMVFTDPPYNVGMGSNTHEKFKQRTIENDSMSRDEFNEFCDLFTGSIEIMTEGCVYVWGAQGPEGRVVFTFLDNKYHWSSTIVWKKDVFVLGRSKYHNKYEPCWFGWIKDGKSFVNDRKLDNVWEFDRPKASKLHPTMKPVKLCEYGINHVIGHSVADPFMGSGTTLIACEKTNRKCYGMELDEKYCQVIIQRWCDYTEKTEIKINGVVVDWDEYKN